MVSADAGVGWECGAISVPSFCKTWESNTPDATRDIRYVAGVETVTTHTTEATEYRLQVVVDTTVRSEQELRHHGRSITAAEFDCDKPTLRNHNRKFLNPPDVRTAGAGGQRISES